MCCENFFQTPLAVMLDEAQRRELSAPSIKHPITPAATDPGARKSNAAGETSSGSLPQVAIWDAKPFWETAQN
jgi:hypothetical protein